MSHRQLHAPTQNKPRQKSDFLGPQHQNEMQGRLCGGDRNREAERVEAERGNTKSAYTLRRERRKGKKWRPEEKRAEIREYGT